MEIPANLIKKENTPIEKKSITPKKALKINKTLYIILGIFSFFVLFLFLFLYLPGRSLLAQIEKTKIVAQSLSQAVSDKDLAKSKEAVSALRLELNTIDNKFKKLAYLKVIPVASNYYHDGQNLIKIGGDALETGEIVIKAIEPYQDFLGFKGTATSSAESTEDRIAFLTQSVESLLPHFDLIETKINEINTLVNEIDINRYPEKFRGIPVHTDYNQAREMISQVKNYVNNGKPILSQVSWLLGKDKIRNYLVIFQNDGELRPSGGFWTAYTTLKVDKGKIIPGISSNIYDLDDKLSSTTLAPRIIKSYHINVPYLNLRDSNLSPDFPTDAQIFLEGYYKAMGKKTTFDAVIAIDTQFLVDLVFKGFYF